MSIATLPRRGPAFAQWRVPPLFASAESFLEREREQLALWWVVGLGVGIGAWFALPSARAWTAALCLAAGIAGLGVSIGSGRLARASAGFALAAALGLALIWVRSGWVAAPRLDRPAITAFAARVEGMQQLAARDSVRLTVAPEEGSLPPLLRVNVDKRNVPEKLSTGSRIRLRARLMPPMPMPLPGAHDYARDAWFAGLGGTGRALGPIEVLEVGGGIGLGDVRDRLDRHIREQLPGSEGGIATALATGDQGAIADADAEAMRRSGLAHLLSVSGLHIAAVVGAAFFVTLRLLALSERLALRVNLVLVAAAVGAAAGIAYTVLTGMQVPTVRSCIAALLVLAGIALGREALSLRLIATGALIVLLVRPESLAGPSFQLSFAAVTSIVTLYSLPWFKRHFERRDDGWAMRAARSFGVMLLTGLAVEIALLPFALYHFHKAGLYGVLANLIAIPMTTFVIMPLEAGALLLDGAGLGDPLWGLTGWAVGWLLWLAHAVAGAKGAVALLPAMPTWAFGAMIAGGLWLCLWNSKPRLLGLLPIAIGVAGAVAEPRPDLLVTGDGRHLAIVGEDGTPFLLRGRAGDFVRDMVGENSGFDGEALELAQAQGVHCTRDACLAEFSRGGRVWRVLALKSNQRLEWTELTAACAHSDIVVAERRLPRGCSARWLKLDRAALARSGGLAITLGEQPEVRTVAERVGEHPWSQHRPSRRMDQPTPRRFYRSDQTASSLPPGSMK